MSGFLKRGKGTKKVFWFFGQERTFLKTVGSVLLSGKNVSKKANIRNKIKRRLRELVRRKIKEIKGGTDGVFIARPGLEKKDFQELEDAVDKIFKKLDFFKKT